MKSAKYLVAGMELNWELNVVSRVMSVLRVSYCSRLVAYHMTSISPTHGNMGSTYSSLALYRPNGDCTNSEVCHVVAMVLFSFNE